MDAAHSVWAVMVYAENLLGDRTTALPRIPTHCARTGSRVVRLDAVPMAHEPGGSLELYDVPIRHWGAHWSPYSGLPEIGRATSELQSPTNLVCRLLLEKKKKHPVY